MNKIEEAVKGIGDLTFQLTLNPLSLNKSWATCYLCGPARHFKKL